MIVGIDLGTTNCAVGVWRDGQARLIPNSLGHYLTPSAISVDPATGEIIVGLPARERQSTHAAHTVTAFKRYMGSSRVTTLGERRFLPEELSALVLSRLKGDAEAFLGVPVTEAVITVPAYFNDRQRKATRRAGQLAGLKVERLLNEPTAAALAYGIHELDNESRFLVFDLGGGTFDVSILEIFEGVIEVRASGGDNHLGGEDFNEVLVGLLTADPRFIAAGLDRHDTVVREKLREAAERARRRLTDAPVVTLSLVHGGADLAIEVTSEAFEAAAAGLLTRLREPVQRALRDSGLRAHDLQEIVLVGGATRMPIVRRATTRMFERFPSNTVHPDEAVAIGAATQAGLKARDIALKDVVLTDVSPYSLGIETSERTFNGVYRPGLFSPIIERNTVVPASRVSRYVSTRDNQAQVTLSIFQGESREVADNIKLGEIDVALPLGPAGVAIDVRFTYDINGLLDVDVLVLATGERRAVTIIDDDTVSPEDLERRRETLQALKQHPREADTNRHVLARAARCYEAALGERREQIGQSILSFEGLLERQDPRNIEPGRSALHTILDQFEGETWL